MYRTTARFQSEINQPSRTFSWSGRITLRNGQKHEFTDKDILKGTGYIQRACSGSSELEIGSVYASEFGMSLFTSIDRYMLEGASLSLNYHLHYEDGRQEQVPMGIFEVTEANRTKKRLELKGYDAMLRFDRRFMVKETFGTAYELLQFICQRCRVPLGMREGEVTLLPNGTEMLSIYPEHDIETYRDLLHYIAATLGSFAMIDRRGQLVLKQYGESPVTTLEASHRFESSLSDFKTFYTAINSTNAKTKIAEYYALENDTGLTMNLGINPLMQLGLKEKRERMCGQLLDAISKISYTPFDATTIGNPSLDPGDRVAFLLDGEVIQTLITSIEYKINGKHRIVGVGKNPYYSQSKSKHDKNLIGILNQIETEQMVIHSYSNAQAFDLSKEDTPIIQIEFASDKETDALFNASILLDVETDKLDQVRTLTAKQTTEEGGEPSVFEFTESVEVPTKIVVTYVLNHHAIEFHVPTETYLSGQHVLSLFFPLSNLQEKTMNRFSVLIRLESGQARIEQDQAIAAISGRSLGTTEVWDGKITIDEMWKREPLLASFGMKKQISDSLVVRFNQDQSTALQDIFQRQRLGGMSLRGIAGQFEAVVEDDV